MPALCMLGALSGAMGKSWQVANVVSQRVTRANLYIVLSLNSGAGKSIANLVARPVTRFEASRGEVFERDQKPDLKSRQIALEADLKRLKQSGKDGPIDQERLKVIVCDLDAVRIGLDRSVALSVGNGTTTG